MTALVFAAWVLIVPPTFVSDPGLAVYFATSAACEAVRDRLMAQSRGSNSNSAKSFCAPTGAP